MASLVPFYEFGEDQFFRSDDAPDDIAARRRNGFMRLAQLYRERFAETRRLTAEAREGISDLQFTDAYRVPFQYSRMVREHLPAGSFLESSGGVTVTDLDGNRFYDLAASYGVNVFGCDFYKSCVVQGCQRVRELGPVLGAYHPVVACNVARLKEISGLDEVSFHMSGTEAVMQAVRLARYHTRRTHLVRFCGAYHGWWGDVQPGVGNPLPAHETYTLAEMPPARCTCCARGNDIACVLVNPVQGLYPNRAAPADSTLVDSGRRAGFDRAAYARWLKELRAVCTQRGIVLIFDEVFLGFRVAPGGVQEYFGVRADLVTYGKTLGGGLPIGVVCGRRQFMKRYRDDRPVDICFARGTFNSHPCVMGAMHEFLIRLDTPEIRKLDENLDALWDGRSRRLNRLLAGEGLPVRVANMSTRLDRLLQRAIALQLDAPILSPCPRPGVELDRNRPHHLQPELHRAGLRGGGGPLRDRRQGHARRRLVVGRRETAQATDQAPDPAGDDRPRAQWPPSCDRFGGGRSGLGSGLPTARSKSTVVIPGLALGIDLPACSGARGWLVPATSARMTCSTFTQYRKISNHASVWA